MYSSYDWKNHKKLPSNQANPLKEEKRRRTVNKKKYIER